MNATEFEGNCRRFWRNSSIAMGGIFLAMFVYIGTVPQHYGEIYKWCNAMIGVNSSYWTAYAIFTGPVFVAFGIIALIARCVRPASLYCPGCGRFIGSREYYDNLRATHACPKCGKIVLQSESSELAP